MFGLFSGCTNNSTVVRKSPDYTEKYKLVKNVVIIPQDIVIYQTSANGSNEKMDEWSAQATANILGGIEDKLKNDGISVGRIKESDLTAETQSRLKDIELLYDSVEGSIINHTSPKNAQYFPEKISNFDYSIGPDIHTIINAADAFLLVRANDHVATAGRNAIKTATAVVGPLLAAFTGIGYVAVPRGESTFMSLALIEAKTGAILWYNFDRSSGSYDLRDPSRTRALLDKVFL